MVSVYTLATRFPEFLHDGAGAALMLCAGLLIGIVLGRHAARHGRSDQVELQRLFGLLAPLAERTRELAEDMSQYRAVVDDMTGLLEAGSERFAPSQRQATAGLLARMMQANEHLQRRLHDSEQLLKRQASEISVHMSEARTDALTGLPNRRAFDEEMARRAAEWRRHGHPLSVVMADVDHFKKLNDRHGHQAGDQVLRGVARLLRDTMRESDFVARYGGEELAVILPDTDIHEAKRAAQRARQAIQDAGFPAHEQLLRLSVSLGVAEMLPSDTSEGLVGRADAALYTAKQQGRNAAFWHDGRQCRPTDGDDVENSVRLSGIEPGDKDAATEAGHASFTRICQDLRRRMEAFRREGQG
jgi:diguanylate cyclase